MSNLSLIEKIKVLMNITLSSPLFLFCFLMSIAVLIIFIISIKKGSKISKWFFIIIWSLLFLILILNYNSIIINILDIFFDGIFMALYFPNITLYIIIVCIINIATLYSLFSKKQYKGNKIINFICALIIDLLLIFTIDIINTNNINVYDTLTMYTNSNLLVLLQLTSAIFVSWILLNLLVSAHRKLKKYDKKEYPAMPEIIFEDV